MVVVHDLHQWQLHAVEGLAVADNHDAVSYTHFGVCGGVSSWVVVHDLHQWQLHAVEGRRAAVADHDASYTHFRVCCASSWVVGWISLYFLDVAPASKPAVY
jgi:hypothetical protein